MLTPLHRAAIPIAIAQTVVWAGIYYVFPAMLPAWQASLGWSRAELSGAFSAALIVSAVAAPLAGGLIDRGWGRAVLAGGMALGAVLLALVPSVTAVWQFYALWIGIGLAMSASLYEACFAVITTTIGTKARSAIVVVTLFAGFAGTLSFPSAHLLSEAYGWQTALYVFSAVVLIVCVPLTLGGVSMLSAFAEPAPPRTEGTAGAMTRKPAFWLLGLAYSAIGLTHGAILTHLLFILAERGAPVWLAVLTASLIGPMQVLGRVVMIATERHVSTFGAAVGCYSAMITAAGFLLATAISPWIAPVFVAFYGAGYGVASIVRPTLTVEFLGRTGFGVVSGLLAIPYVLGFAIGPTAAAIISESVGYDAVILGAATVSGLGLLAVTAARRSTLRDPPASPPPA